MDENFELKRHPKFSFVAVDNDRNYYCIEHKCGPMNRGGIVQHLRGRAHRIDYFTGEKTHNDKRLGSAELPISSNSIYDFKQKLDFVFAENNFPKREIMIRAFFEGELQDKAN